MTQSLKQGKEVQTQLKRESKSFEAIQQGTVLALLNTFGFGFEFKRPERIAEKTLQFLIIVEVFYNGKPLEFGKKIDIYCDEQFQAEVDDKMSINQVKSLKRRRDLNRAALSFNWLIEYVQQFGYLIERRSTKSAKKTLQMEKINKVYKRNGHYFTAAEIHSIGKEMNAYIISQFVKVEKTTKLNECDAFCIELIKKYDRRSLPQPTGSPVSQKDNKEGKDMKDSKDLKDQNSQNEKENIEEKDLSVGANEMKEKSEKQSEDSKAIKQPKELNDLKDEKEMKDHTVPELKDLKEMKEKKEKKNETKIPMEEIAIEVPMNTITTVSKESTLLQPTNPPNITIPKDNEMIPLPQRNSKEQLVPSPTLKETLAGAKQPPAPTNGALKDTVKKNALKRANGKKKLAKGKDSETLEEE